ncbi:G-protein coupled receptor Mth2 [Anabrus simplex]|uniref:G-protein coupled receptor Mth2 n=1 Tax=Anabrus simplex TaxID=316456 RepID=UPI0034DD5C10
MWRTSMSVVLWWALLTNVNSLPAECAAAPNKACVHKCCPEGHVYQDDLACHNSSIEFRIRLGENATSFADPDTYVIVYGSPCKGRKYPQDPTDDRDYNYLLPDGSLVVPYMFTDPLAPTDFCMETLQENGDSYVTPFICEVVESSGEKSAGLHVIIYPIVRLISVPFLLVTVLVYYLIPELGDLNGKAVSSYCSCLAVAYVLLACVELGSSSFSDGVCSTLGYMLQYFLTASFFWLSILSVDTFWCILAATKLVRLYPQLPRWKWDETEQRWDEIEEVDYEWQEIFSRATFVLYSTYAWGFPLTLLAVVMLLGLKPAIPTSYIKSPTGNTHCWFSSEETVLHYFYVPIIILMLMSLLLFGFTTLRVVRFNWNRTGDHRIPKHKARMALLVFLLAGFSSIFQIVSWVVGGSDFAWALPDTINVSQGIIISIIYVVEPRVWNIVRSTLCDALSLIVSSHCCRQRPLSVEFPLPDEGTILTNIEASFEVRNAEVSK